MAISASFVPQGDTVRARAGNFLFNKFVVLQILRAQKQLCVVSED